jgi:hypothetical protein
MPTSLQLFLLDSDDLETIEEMLFLIQLRIKDDVTFVLYMFFITGLF